MELHEMVARQVRAEVGKLLGEFGVRLGTCTSTSPLRVRLNGDTADVPAKAIGGWSPALGPVIGWLAQGQLWVTEREAI